MKMIPAENVRKFISALENIFYALHLDDATWHEINTITDLHLGTDIRKTANDEIIKEIAIFWYIDDVQSVRPDLTDNQASNVLQSLKKNHDADQGISWPTIEIVADSLFPESISTSSN
jgi:hypothetical protein